MTLPPMVCYVSCDYCGAERGERCRTVQGVIRWKPHLSRINSAHESLLATLAEKQPSQIDLLKGKDDDERV